MRQAYTVTGMLWGDEGKGRTVDWLAAQNPNSLVVRFNGGSQAAHNVVTPDGRHHTFSQFGSGTLAGANTHLGQYMRVHPHALLAEAAHLIEIGERDVFDRITVDYRCLITTPFHTEKSRQIAPIHKRGSCGMGVGETLYYARRFPSAAIIAWDLEHPAILRVKLNTMKMWYQSDLDVDEMMEAYHDFRRFIPIISASDFARIQANHDVVIFEGAQGVLLDYNRGDRPYVTSSNTTDELARKMIPDHIPTERIGCMRIYATRHGVGPFPQELPPASQNAFPELHNTEHRFRESGFRRGWLDIGSLHRSIKINNGYDWISVGHLDLWDKLPMWQIGGFVTQWESDYLIHLNQELNIPLKLLADGPTRKDMEYYA